MPKGVVDFLRKLQNPEMGMEEAPIDNTPEQASSEDAQAQGSNEAQVIPLNDLLAAMYEQGSEGNPAQFHFCFESDGVTTFVIHTTPPTHRFGAPKSKCLGCMFSFMDNNDPSRHLI